MCKSTNTHSKNCIITPACKVNPVTIDPQFQRFVKQTADKLEAIRTTSEVEASIESLSQKIEKFQTSLQEFAAGRHQPQQATTYTTTPHPHTPVLNPTKAYENYTQTFVSREMSQELTTFLSTATFSEKNGRAVVAYGEPYHYTGSGPNKPVQMPEPIKKLISRIEQDHPEHGINSCVVNRYKGPKSFLVEHQDNEKSIRPESNIFTISLGSTAMLKFRECCSDNEQSVTVEDCSIYLMSQPSQYYWRHRVDPTADPANTDYMRYSITLRSVHRFNKNSTIILGDSNTRFLEPSNQAIFGKDMSGRRELTFHIRDINPELCAGYQHIIVHVGINDLNEYSIGRMEGDPDPGDVDSHFALLVSKLDEIQQLCLYARLIVSPILPTKLQKLNERAIQFNHMLMDYVSYHNNIVLLNFIPFVCKQSGLLDKQFGSYKKPKHPVHLGKQGISLLGSIFKDSVFRRKVDGRGYSSVVANQAYALHFPALPRWVTEQWDQLVPVERFVDYVQKMFLLVKPQYYVNNVI